MTAVEFKERFLSLYPKLFAIAMANTGNSDEAKDVMQSLYLKLWERRSELKDVGNEMGYCRTVLMNQFHDRWRSKAVEPELAAVEYDFPCEGHAGFETDDIKDSFMIEDVDGLIEDDDDDDFYGTEVDFDGGDDDFED